MDRARVDPGQAAAEGYAFLLVQLGFHVARQFAERLAPLGLEPRQFSALSRLAANEGESQQALAQLIGLNATRMVFLIDELERLGLAERRRNPADRRSHALYLTDRGRQVLAQAQEATAGHEKQIGAPLGEKERAQLTSLLRRLADALHIQPDSLPGPPPWSAGSPSAPSAH